MFAVDDGSRYQMHLERARKEALAGRMTDPSQADGACFCGAVSFRVTLPASFCVHCHCTMCRRLHGAGYVTWFVVPRAQLSLTNGEDALVRYQSSDHGTRSFCRICGSSLFCESTRRPDSIDIVLGNMSSSIGLDPQAHIFFDSSPDWICIGDSLPRLGGATGEEPIDTH
jgi:hypothetical protein